MVERPRLNGFNGLNVLNVCGCLVWLPLAGETRHLGQTMHLIPSMSIHVYTSAWDWADGAWEARDFDWLEGGRTGQLVQRCMRPRAERRVADITCLVSGRGKAKAGPRRTEVRCVGGLAGSEH